MAYFFTNDINETFIIEPLSLTGGSPTFTACTAIFSNSVVSCTGDTQIILSNGMIIFDSDLNVFDNLTGNTISATTYYSGGTDLFNVIIGTSSQYELTGGTFNRNDDTLSLNIANGNIINISGITDYYITGGTFLNDSKTLRYTRNDNQNIDVVLPIRTINFSSGATISNQSLVIDVITGLTDNSNSFIVSYVTAYKDNIDYGFWKRTLAINKNSGNVTVIGENSDFDRISSGMTPNSVIYSADSGNISIIISGETSKNYYWESNWELIK